MAIDKRPSVDIPYIDSDDPLPALPKAEGRWHSPYVSEETGMWSVVTRHPLSQAEVEYGLRSLVSAETLDRLGEYTTAEDQKHREFLALQMSHRNTG